MLKEYESVIKLLVPIGVLLSAGLASTSVMKSIDNTNKIENNKIKIEKLKIKRRTEFYINQLLFELALIHIKSKQIKDYINKNDEEKAIYHYNEIMPTNFTNYNKKIEMIVRDKEIIDYIDSYNLSKFLTLCYNLSARNYEKYENINVIQTVINNEEANYNKIIIEINFFYMKNIN